MKSEENRKARVLGVDLVDGMPDYKKTPEENWEEYRKRYYEVYGIWLPTYEEAKQEMNA